MTRRLALLLTCAAAGLALLSGAAGAGPVRLTAHLNVRQVPGKVYISQTSHGTFAATITGNRLTWRLTFDVTTVIALAAHIRVGRPGAVGPVLYGLCSPCSTPARGVQIPLSAAARRALESGRAYVNVETTANPKGEIRGQIRRVVG